MSLDGSLTFEATLTGALVTNLAGALTADVSLSGGLAAQISASLTLDTDLGATLEIRQPLAGSIDTNVDLTGALWSLPATAVYLSKVNIFPPIAVIPPTRIGGLYPKPSLPQWRWAVGDWHGEAQRELATISARKLTIKLQDADEASFALLGDAPDTPQVRELVDDLHIWRNGEKLFRGRVGDSADNIADTYTAQFTARDYRDVLDYHLLYAGKNPQENPFWPSIDFGPFDVGGFITPEDIIWQLIQNGQSYPNTSAGITKGLWPVTGVRLVEFQSFEDGFRVYSDCIDKYVKSVPGLDFYIDPQKRANIYVRRGTDRGAILDYGGVITGVQRQFNRGTYANVVRQSGSDPALSIYQVADDIIARPEGSWAIPLGDTTLTTAEAVGQIAMFNFNTRSAARPGDTDIATGGRAYSVTFALGAWGGPQHVWVGDTVRLVVRRGRLAVDDVLRVYEISIDIAQDGNETVTATLNWPTNPADKLTKLINNVWLLNKR